MTTPEVLHPLYPALFQLGMAMDVEARGVCYQGVSVALFRSDPQPRAFDYAPLLGSGDSGGGWNDCAQLKYARDFLDVDLFTPRECRQVGAYLARVYGREVTKARFSDFPVRDAISVTMMSRGTQQGIWAFDEAPGFDCPTPFRGYYDLRSAAGLLRDVDVRCSPDGSVALQGVTLAEEDVARLAAGANRARRSEAEVRLRLRVAEVLPGGG